MRPLADGDRLLAPIAAAEHLLTQLTSPARLLLAVSGGSDSTGLLLALTDVIKRHSGPPVTLSAVTIDHGLRAQAADEAQRVAEFCADLAITHVIRRWEGPKPDTGLSAAARAARYDLLSSLADETSATAILTGHTLDDQFETLFMRGARIASDQRAESQSAYSGLGLAGMAPAVLLNRRHLLLRPFLQTRRHAIRSYLAERGLGWIDDPSNTDARFERARTRANLAPIDDAQAALQLLKISLAGKAREKLASHAAELLDRHLVVVESVVARLDAAALSVDPAVLLHALATLTAVLGGRVHLPAADSLQRLGAFLAGEASGRLTIGRVLIDRRRDALYLVRESRDLPQQVLQAGESCLWDGRMRIRNHSNGPVVIGPHDGDRKAAGQRFPNIPSGVAMAGFRALPQVLREGDRQRQKVTIDPVLRPFDHFAGQFDWKLVNSLAMHMGLA
ncbi:tRNA lysidine(34) synthetase TilS [Rhizobium sp. FY34]|uniref:tRNA lysidine(34) synthetase TilS n=1 Tax=Rhizobium sp. FY34 TaxID=2562309 RepID=UPI0010C113B8|nr:tRNA lysidine(34) synthetase TilS [Rhizobium sp. FY34]